MNIFKIDLMTVLVVVVLIGVVVTMTTQAGDRTMVDNGISIVTNPGLPTTVQSSLLH